jgi:ribosomal protein L19E
MVNLSQQKRLAASVAGVGQRKSKSWFNWMDGVEERNGREE